MKDITGSDIDLEKVFDTVEYDRLISVLNKEIKDGKILR